MNKEVSEITVYFKDSRNNYRSLRICAVKKTQEEISIEEKRLKISDSKRQREEASEVCLNVKMLIAILIEKYLGDIDFSPSCKLRKESEYMEGNKVSISFDF